MDRYLTEATLGHTQELVLTTDTAVQALARLFAETDVDTLKSYLAFHCIDGRAPVLSEEWDKANFDFHVRRLAGVQEQQSLNNRALTFLSGEFGEVLGRAYARKYFPQDYREQMNRMVDHLRRPSMCDSRRTPGWTRRRRRRPSRSWTPSSATSAIRTGGVTSLPCSFDPGDLVGNWRRIAQFELADAVKALGEPRRDWMWAYPAMEINAGYSPQTNSITFPAGILQSPFFDPFADPAVNYGSIGAVIGMNWAMPSTTRAASRTPPARCATGGRQPREPSSASAPTCSCSNTPRIRRWRA